MSDTKDTSDSQTTSEAVDAPAVIMLPPTLVLIHISLGITLNWLFPINLPHWLGGVGLILLAAAFTVTYWSKKCFEEAGTNTPPNKPALTIVNNGPYQYTRNPMYLSMMAGFIALSLMAGGLMMLILAVPLFIILDQKVIKPEEDYLERKFGETYSTYKKTAGRWFKNY